MLKCLRQKIAHHPTEFQKVTCFISLVFFYHYQYIKVADARRYQQVLHRFTDDDLVTRLALVHQRFSTNTFHLGNSLNPFVTCHNGEIIHLRGNISRMRAREELMKSDVLAKTSKAFQLFWKENQIRNGYGIELLLMTVVPRKL
jgi:hypothetical protein